MNKDYYVYLTQRLDKGICKNPVVKETEKLIKEILKRKSVVCVADIGCFSGSVINRIYENLPIKFKDRVRLVGIDNNREALTKRKKDYPAITFVLGDLLKGIPLVNQYDVIILSNVLHEVYSEKIRKKQSLISGNKAVRLAINNAVSLLDGKGFLIILDGIKPSFFSKSITVEFTSKLILEKMLDFAEKYKILPVKVESLSGEIIRTDLGSLAVFLTKARYLDESYWKQESLEVYQFFAARDFEKMLRREKMRIVKFELQNFSRAEIRRQVKSVKPSITVPAKNVLIVAKKF